MTIILSLILFIFGISAIISLMMMVAVHPFITTTMIGLMALALRPAYRSVKQKQLEQYKHMYLKHHFVPYVKPTNSLNDPGDDLI